LFALNFNSLDPISVGKIMISILTGVLYIVYIIISVNAEILEIGVAWFYLRIDYSVFGLFIIPVPILAIIRNLLIFIYEYKSIRCKLAILEALAKNKVGSQNQIRKFILKSKEINPNIKRHVLKDFKEILHELETHHPHPLIIRQSQYKVTRTGQNFLKRYGIKSFKEDKSLSNLEVWTEEDIEKFARKRALKIK